MFEFDGFELVMGLMDTFCLSPGFDLKGLGEPHETSVKIIGV